MDADLLFFLSTLKKLETSPSIVEIFTNILFNPENTHDFGNRSFIYESI